MKFATSPLCFRIVKKVVDGRKCTEQWFQYMFKVMVIITIFFSLRNDSENEDGLSGEIHSTLFLHSK